MLRLFGKELVHAEERVDAEECVDVEDLEVNQIEI